MAQTSFVVVSKVKLEGTKIAKSYNTRLCVSKNLLFLVFEVKFLGVSKKVFMAFNYSSCGKKWGY